MKNNHCRFDFILYFFIRLFFACISISFSLFSFSLCYKTFVFFPLYSNNNINNNNKKKIVLSFQWIIALVRLIHRHLEYHLTQVEHRL